MKKVFLIHGFGGSPNGGWRPWLMRELEKHDVYACALAMPSPDKPLLNDWLAEVDHHIKSNTNDVIYLVGHSLGGTTILRYLQKFDCNNVKGIVIASAPAHQNANGKIADFLKDEFDWKNMRGKVKKVVVIHGDNDPLVPLSDAQESSEKLQGRLVVIPDGKHLNGSAGFTELPECLSALLEMINKQ